MTSGAPKDVSLEELPLSEQDRLAKILDGYLASIEEGCAVTPEQLLAQHPAEAPYLRSCLSGLNLFHPAAGREAPGPPLVGGVIGDYRLLREVGRGGMGVVYEAEQLSLKRRVALKVLPEVAASDDKQRRRFLVESQTAASIEHPNILPVFCIGQDRGTHFYAMRLVDGPSLGEWIGVQRDSAETIAASSHRARGDETRGSSLLDSPPPARHQPPSHLSCVESFSTADLRRHVERVARFGAQAAGALHAAHEHGVIHRDMKPSNLLIDTDDKLWVTDFGLARCREGAGLTRSGDLLGTLKYMSPEQKAGSVIDHRSDIYSLGLTLYEAAALRWPHPNDDAGLASLNAKGTPSMRRWERRIPVDFDTIIMKSLADAPAERYQTASELADDLRRFLNHEPIRAKPPGPLRRVSKWARRRQHAVVSGIAALIVATVAMSVALVLVSREQRRAQKEADHATAQTQKTREVLDLLGLRLTEQLAPIPGADRVRHQALEVTLAYYQELVDVAGDDPVLQADVAMAYGKLGELTARSADRQQAIEYYQQGIETIERLLAASPRDTQTRRQLAVLQSNLGGLLREEGSADSARLLLSSAMRSQQELAASDRDSKELMAELAATHSSIGLLALDGGATADAAAAFNDAIGLFERSLDDAPDEWRRRLLAVAYCNSAAAHEANQPTEAQRFLGDAIDVQKRLVADQPLNLVYQADLARSYNNLGRLHAGLHQWAEAQRCYRSAIDLQSRLVKVSPSVELYHRDLAVSQNNLGMVTARMGDVTKAVKLFEESADLQLAFLKRRPDDMQALVGLGGTFNNAAVLQRDRGDIQAAHKLFAKAVELQKRAHAIAPHDQRVNQLLINHLDNYAGCCRRLGLATEADEAAALRERVLAAANHAPTPVAEDVITTTSASRSGADIQQKGQAL